VESVCCRHVVSLAAYTTIKKIVALTLDQSYVQFHS